MIFKCLVSSRHSSYVLENERKYGLGERHEKYMVLKPNMSIHSSSIQDDTYKIEIRDQKFVNN